MHITFQAKGLENGCYETRHIHLGTFGELSFLPVLHVIPGEWVQRMQKLILC